MRLHRLELQAFGPFAGRESVDFTVLNDAGLFLLDGPTGAGKSTVLAGICFALYGSVPGDRTPESLASTQSALGARPEVLLDFTVGGRRFEVLRWPRYRRPARRRLKDGTGLTEEKAGAVLRELREGQWQELSVRADEIGQLMHDVLYLDADQFMRVVLLPQGEFATFLRARSAEKETLLRKLFGTGRYDGVEEYLSGQHKTLEAAVSRDRDQVAASRADLTTCLAEGLGEHWWVPATTDPDEAPDGTAPDGTAPGEATVGDQDAPGDWSDEDLADRGTTAVAAAVEEAVASRRHVTEVLAGAQGRLEELTRRQQDIRAAREWQERRERHGSLAEQVAEDRRAVERHHSAVPVDRRAHEADEAASSLRAGRADLGEARSAALAEGLCRTWADADTGTGTDTGTIPDSGTGTDLGTTPPGDLAPEDHTAAGEETDDDVQVITARFDAIRQRADRDLDRLSDRERDAESLQSTQVEATRLEQSIGALTVRAQEATERRAALETTHAGLTRRLEELSAPAAGLESARTAVEDAGGRYSAALEHEGHREALAVAEDGLRAATDRAQAAVDAWHEVVERRLAGAASLLAAGLRPDEPCQVCGSVEHPEPAAAGGEEISAEAQEAARRRMEECAAGRREAQEAVDRARAVAEVSRVRAGGLGPEDAAVALASAREALQEAERADRDLVAARAALVQNEQEQQEQATVAESARQKAAVADARLATATAEVARLRRAVDEALGGRASLSERRRDLEAARALVVAVLDAARVVTTRQSLARQAAEGRDELLDASAFATVEEARSAVLAEDTERTLAARIREWDREEVALAALGAGDAVVRGRDLLERAVPAPNDEEIADQAAGVADAARARDEAASRTGGLESLQRQVSRQARVLREVAERSAGQLAELEETEGLLRLVRGQGENALKMTLGSYVLAGRLEEVVASATERLLGMTQGRYELRHDDAARGRGVRGLDITVFDRYTEDERAAGTLSGGETFMASLALALGLADTVQAEAGGVDMDTLFVDEGFGSLDASSLADVMDVLDGLQADGRTIGVVSHVDRMRQDIGYRLQVTKTRQGSHLEVIVPGEG